MAKPDTSLDLTDLKSGTTLKEFWENAKKALEQTGADLAGLPRPGAELEKFEGYSVRPEVADLVERIGPVMPEEEECLRKRIQNVLKDDLKRMEAFQRELRIVLEDGEMDPEIRINLLAWGDEFGAEIRKWIRGPVIEIIGKPD